MTTEQFDGALIAAFIAVVIAFIAFIAGANVQSSRTAERCDKLGNVLIDGVPYECRRLDGQPKRVKVMV